MTEASILLCNAIQHNCLISIQHDGDKLSFVRLCVVHKGFEAVERTFEPLDYRGYDKQC